ncbi:MAG: DUF6382 domain-containing protein [Lachnospiraceae bacterium]|nr:DUF6382 domain-containing protein [Lachnospiraceae bacterium]
MKISYRREMKHNYMIIDPEALVWKNYECRMLTANTLEGVLHFQIRQIDDEIRFYYEITSKQPLSRLLESRSVRTEEIRSLILGISAVLDRMETYLLRENSVLLDPDQIYVEPESFRIWLCVVPGMDQGFPEHYGKLLEYLLGKVDHQDKDSVVLAYGLYQETRKDNYGMEDILRLLYAGQEKPQKPQEPQYTEEEPVPAEAVAESYRGQAERKREGRSERRSEGKAEAPEEKPGLLERLKNWWNRRGKKHKEPDLIQVPWNMMFHEEDEEKVGAEVRDGKLGFGGNGSEFRSSRSEFVGTRSEMIGSQPESEIPDGSDTVLLADLSLHSAETVRKLRALEPGTEDIVLSYYPFVIGKQENLVDYLLAKDTVSRLHLRIDREGDQYYVQDLNSTNGTTVGGVLLENNARTELKVGDEVGIAECRYRFE